MQMHWFCEVILWKKILQPDRFIEKQRLEKSTEKIDGKRLYKGELSNDKKKDSCECRRKLTSCFMLRANCKKMNR